MTANQYQHWRLENDEHSIAWLYADRKNSSTNTLSAEVIGELDAIIRELDNDPPKGLVILSAKENGFFAGADIKELAKANDVQPAREFIQLGQDTFNRLERLRFPTVCLIHGFCMGGGLELALACRYRIADDDTKTRLGFPEIKIGIFPAFGGATRLPPLIGAPAAMGMMLTGRNLSARAAKKIGVIDYAVPKRHLQQGAVQLINTRPAPQTLKGWKRLTNHALVRPLLAYKMRLDVAKKASPNHYPAPYALIDLWAKHANDKYRMLEGEQTHASRLIVGKTSQNLIRVFFLQDQLKSAGDKSLFKPKHVHVIGAGVMGGDIAAWCASQGMHVTVQDRAEAALGRVIKNAYGLFKKTLKAPVLIQAALDRITPDINGLGLKHADVVIEAIFENLEAKQSLFQSIEPQLKPGALLATNTSSIPIETLSQALSEPSRLVGIHFFNPVSRMQLVEIVSGSTTSAEASTKAAAFTRHINRLPLPVKSSPGFLVNRVLMPYLVEAVVLEAEGIAPQVIDQAAVDFGMPMGPIELADTVGLDICLSVAEILSQQLNLEVPHRLKSLVDAGRLGRKSGRGFYQYKNGKPLHHKAGKSDYRPEDIQDRLMLRMLNEVVACLREGIVDNADLVDAGIIFGTGFAPFRGGPLHYRQSRGVNTLYNRLLELEKKHGERFTPDTGWCSNNEDADKNQTSEQNEITNHSEARVIKANAS
ncbi:3-hydroxyacyl-CoA dehydrogenase NAD-binding domain-containing protein [Kaarinaea lacus]